MWNAHKQWGYPSILEATPTKEKPSSVIIERDWMNEGSQQLVCLNFRIFICLVMESECSEGTTRKPTGIDFPN